MVMRSGPRRRRRRKKKRTTDAFLHWVEYHARFILFVALFLSIAGAVGAFSVPAGLFPPVAFPCVQVSLDSGDRPGSR
jgi:hypothetical protein